MIGDTASINLLTGLPGSGKSLRFAEAISTMVAMGKKVYYSNIEGLKVKGAIPWPDPKDWRDIPAGGILFVDEAQEFFPARRSGNPPPEVLMNRIRHDGITLVLGTQQPDYLDSYLRGLVGRHEHLLRREGKQESFMFADNAVMENVRQKVKVVKRTYDYTTYKFNPKYFEMYESAQIHTMKWQMPQLMKRALIIGPIACLMVIGAWGYVFGDAWAMKKKGEELEANAADSTGGSPSGSRIAAANTANSSRERTPKTAEEYVLDLVPRISHQPWSAPVFDSANAAARAKPEFYCMSSGPGEMADGDYLGDTCSCITEQGTRYELDQQTCFAVVKQGGVYNPFREPTKETAPDRREEGDPDRDRQERGTVAALPGGRSEEPQTKYGAMRNKELPAELSSWSM